MFHNKHIFSGEELLAPRPTPKLEDLPCRLYATAYSIYSQLEAVSSIRNLRTRPAVVARDPPNEYLITFLVKLYKIMTTYLNLFNIHSNVNH
jgi:hypothetical protein